MESITEPIVPLSQEENQKPLKTVVCRGCGKRKEARYFRSLRVMMNRPEKKFLCKECQRSFLEKQKMTIIDFSISF